MATVEVKYNGTKIVPAPLISITQNFIKTGDGQKIGVTYEIELAGTVVRGTKTAGGTAQVSGTNFDQLLESAKSLRALFKNEGKRLEIFENSTRKVSGYARVMSLNFGSNQYITTAPFTVSLQIDDLEYEGSSEGAYTEINTTLGLSSNHYVNSANDDWSVAPAGQKKGFVRDDTSGSTYSAVVDESEVYTMTHTISAVGKRVFDSTGLIRPAWQNAEAFVMSRVGIPTGTSVSSNGGLAFLFNGPVAGEGEEKDAVEFVVGHSSSTSDTYKIYNYTRQQQVNQTDGTFSITETYTLVKKSKTAAGVDITDSNVIEDINVQVSKEKTSVAGGTGTTELKNVTLSGTITGLETRATTVGGNTTFSSITETRATAAQNRLDDITDTVGYNIAVALSGESDLVSPFITKNVTKNPATGAITFSFTFNNRKQVLSGKSISETGSHSKTYPIQKFATIEVPGRASGPIMQNIGTQTLTQETAQISVTLEPGSRNPQVDQVGQRTGSALGITNDNFLDIAGVPNLSRFRGTGSNSATVIVTADNESYDKISGQYSRTKTIQYTESC